MVEAPSAGDARLHLILCQKARPNPASTALSLSARLLNTLCPSTRTARVLGQHHCLQRGTSAPDSKIIRRLLQLRQNASVFAQGCADFPSDSSDRDHSFTPDQDTSVSGQRCADLPASSADRSHHFKSDPWRTSSPLHPNLGFRYPQSPLVARTSVTDVTRQPATAIALQYSRSLLSLERQTRAVVRPGMRKMVRREIMERFDMSRPMHQIGNSRTNPLQTEHHRQMSTCSEHSRRRSKV